MAENIHQLKARADALLHAFARRYLDDLLSLGLEGCYFLLRAQRDGWPYDDALALTRSWPTGTHWLAPVPVWRGEGA